MKICTRAPVVVRLPRNEVKVFHFFFIFIFPLFGSFRFGFVRRIWFISTELRHTTLFSIHMKILNSPFYVNENYICSPLHRYACGTKLIRILHLSDSLQCARSKRNRRHSSDAKWLYDHFSSLSERIKSCNSGQNTINELWINLKSCWWRMESNQNKKIQHNLSSSKHI